MERKRVFSLDIPAGVRLAGLSLALTAAMLASPTQAQVAQTGPAVVAPADSVFAMPRLHALHRQLVGQLKKAIEKNDYRAMDEIATYAVRIFPEDATWRYNLACARTRVGKPREALAILAEAVRLGFTDSNAIAADPDLAVLRREKAFADILAEAHDLALHPEKRRRVTRPFKVDVPKVARVDSSNTTWDMENGGFISLFAIQLRPDEMPTNLYARLPGKAGEKLLAWQEEGTAAGNWGDLYDNLDRGHSTIDRRMFPGLTPIRYGQEAVSNGIDNMGATLITFAGQTVIGNSSTALTQGPAWRSTARNALGQNMRYLVQQYLNNEMYVYPQHHDYLPTIAGDVFPSRTPYIYISHGSSWTDRPIMNALAAALAALRPETKERLVRAHLVAPVLRYLIYSSQKDIFRRTDYLVPSSHPIVMNGDRIDLVRLVEAAHSLTTNSLPPMVALRMIGEEGAGKTPGVDYFDLARGEALAETPFAICRVFRGMAYTRKYTLEAMPVNPRADTKLAYHWVIIQGDNDKIRIKPHDDTRRVVDVEIDYHEAPFDTPFGMPSSRVEIALIADDGTHYSPAAFFSCFFLANENRTYSQDHQILGVDYASGRSRYVDPEISLPKDWRDIYAYDKSGRVSGWTRVRDGEEPVAFNASGEKIVKPVYGGKPAETVHVNYGAREISTPDGPSLALVELE